MNLDFQIIGQINTAGTLCNVEMAVVPNSYKHFWIAWRSMSDQTFKKSLMLRKENNMWTVTRIVPVEQGLKLPPIPVSYHLKNTMKLLPYQPKSVAGLTRSVIDNGFAVDGSDTGLGKTYCALAVARELNMRPAIICKKAGIAVWRRASLYMGSNPVFIVNWEMARTGKFPYIRRNHHEWEASWLYDYSRVPEHTLLIYDECHVACNPETQNNRLWLGSRSRPAVYLSATLADRPARLESLFYMLKICNPKDYREWLVRQGCFLNRHNELESLSVVQDMKTIHKILYPRYGVRLSYQDEAVSKYFPDAVYQVELISLDESARDFQNDRYQAMLQKVVRLREMGKSHADVMVAELRFRQSAELLKVPALVDYAKDYMLEGRSVCIFVNFRDTLAEIAKSLDTRSLIFGDQERININREKVIEDFQENRTRVILCMIDAGGQSIDLHDLKGGHQRISLVCPTYNPIALKQVLGRTYRANVKSIPIIKLVYTAGTIEEKVADTVAAKLDNIDALNRGDLMETDIFNILKE